MSMDQYKSNLSWAEVTNLFICESQGKASFNKQDKLNEKPVSSQFAKYSTT